MIPASNASRIPVPPQVIREGYPYPNKSIQHSECTVLDCGYVVLEFAAECKHIPAVDWGRNRPTELSLLKTDRLEGGGGVGLRLRIAQDIVQRHHGMLILETEEEELDGYRRTSIKVYLPCSRRVLEGDSGQKVHSHHCCEDASTVRNIGGHADHQFMGFTVPPTSSGIGAHSGNQSALLLDSSTGAGAPVELLRSCGSLVVLREDSARQVPLGSGRGGTERRVVEYGDDEDDDDGGKDDVSGNRQMFSKRVSLPLSSQISVNAGVLRIPSKPRMMRIVPATSFKARKRADSTPLEDIVAEYNSVSSRCVDVPPNAADSFMMQNARDNLCIRVLVVDDSELNRKVIKRSVDRLAAEYYQKNVVFFIDQCDDGTSACESVARSLELRCPYDLVLMDNIMMHMNGPEAAEKMRRGGYRGHIAGVTGNVMAKDLRQFMESGADCVLAKPLDIDRLRELVSHVVELATV